MFNDNLSFYNFMNLNFERIIHLKRWATLQVTKYQSTKQNIS